MQCVLCCQNDEVLSTNDEVLMLITSFNNPKIKLVNRLKEEKFRAQEKKFIIEGFTLVEEAVNNLSSPEILYLLISSTLISDPDYNPFLQKIKNKGILGYEIEQNLLEKISDLETPSILGVVKQRKNHLQEVLKGKDSIYLLIDRLQDPGNLGTIIRTAEACGVKALFLNKGTVDPYNPKVVRASMGSIFRLPLVKVENLENLIFTLKDKKVKIFASSSHKGVFYYSQDYKFPLALIIGNEAEGIAQEILSLADSIVSIPLNNKVESLNVSVATAVILFEMVKRR